MKLNQLTPNTPHTQFLSRMCNLWDIHPECKIPCGDIGPAKSVIQGHVCVMMIAKGPLMICRRVDKSATQFLFDAYGS